MPSTGQPHCRPRARVTSSSLTLRWRTSHSPQLAAPCRPLRRQSGAQVLLCNPALLEHGQAERNAMPMALPEAASSVHLPPDCRFHTRRRTCRRATPSTLEDGCLPAAPQVKPSRPAMGVGAGRKDPWPHAGRNADRPVLHAWQSSRTSPASFLAYSAARRKRRRTV